MSIKRHGGRILALFAALLALAVPSAASAATGTLTTTGGNPGCADIDSGWTELKIDRTPSNGTYAAGGSTLEVVISNRSGNDFDWSSNAGIDAVLVKGGTETNVYSYDPEATSDTGLSAPGNYGISHVSFCYDEGSPPPAPPTCEEQNAGGPDADGDGVVDACDNCPDAANAGQEDSDSDGMGDACEPQQPNPPREEDEQQAPTAPPAPEQQSAPAVDQPGQVVLGERVSAPRARLLAPSGCVSRSFSARVRGTGIARVVFRIDGKKVKVVRKPNRRGLFALRVSPAKFRIGVHRIVARVVFRKSRGTAPRRLRSAFQRCGKQLVAPRFTG